MRAGDVIADRFVIEAPGGEGGIGMVYRALDRERGARVAVKVLKNASAQSEQRFAREAEVLRELDHPAIVNYVWHGRTPDGRLFLVMEWLEGETLEMRLMRQGLTVQEAIDLVRRVAAALGQAHRRGIVHRDLKPSNLFLIGKRLDALRILDFGVARVKAQSSLTRTGVPVGTPNYMAPEQARGATEIDARADVFALGCVLFECLTGRQAFPGDQAVAVLARVMFEPAPHVGKLRPDLPESIEALLTAMLAKNPMLRLRDAEAVAHALDVVEDRALPTRAPVVEKAPALTYAEQKLMTLVVVADNTAFDDRTLPEADVSAQADLLGALAEFYGARFEFVAGAKVLYFSAYGAAVDQAAQAARSALELATRLDAPVAIATGWAVLAGHVPVGEVLERALTLSANARSEGGVHLDEATAGLLSTRFALSDDGRRLFQERGADEPARMLLGRLTPCVGRERELRMLETVLAECAAGPIASAVLVSGAAGVGKSRLRDEFLLRAAASKLDYRIWSARGDAMKRGFAFELLRGIARAAGSASPAALDRLLSPSDGARPEVHAVDSVRLAWLELIDRITAESPLLIAIDDVHLGDSASLSLIDAALDRYDERPLFVLAFGRRELHKAFPRLWADRALQEIRLPELTRRASVELVRAVLGSEPSDEVVSRIVDHAGGNAFVLEELIRTTTQTDAVGLPRSAVAVAQARLGRIESEARHVLKAASVFGDCFWVDGVRALLGPKTAGLARTLDSLEAREFVGRDVESRFARETQYRFRHSLLSEAAYALLTDDDRAVAHRLAAEWLEASAETNAALVAEHFELGGEARRAIPWWRRASDQALEANEFGLAVQRAERGISAGAHGPALGELSVTLGEAARWLGDLVRADSALREARALLPRGSDLWCVAAREHAVVLQRAGRTSEAAELGRELVGAVSREGGELGLAIARVRTAMALSYLGESALVNDLVARVRAETPEQARDSALLDAMLRRLCGDEASRRGDFATLLTEVERSVERFREAGLERQAVSETVTVGYALLELGAYERARDVLAGASEAADRLGLAQPAAVAKQNLGLVLARLGRLDDALDTESEALETFVELGERRMEGAARVYLAMISIERGALDVAEREARLGVELLAEAAPPLVAEARATLSSALLASGRAAEALDVASAALAALDAGGAESGEALIRLGFVRASFATGDRERSLAALHVARERLLERALAIGDPALRDAFLRRVPENAATLALAAELFG
jgi:tetratricopeptide (TPR) repeat protein